MSSSEEGHDCFTNLRIAQFFQSMATVIMFGLFFGGALSQWTYVYDAAKGTNPTQGPYYKLYLLWWTKDGVQHDYKPPFQGYIAFLGLLFACSCLAYLTIVILTCYRWHRRATFYLKDVDPTQPPYPAPPTSWIFKSIARPYFLYAAITLAVCGVTMLIVWDQAVRPKSTSLAVDFTDPARASEAGYVIWIMITVFGFMVLFLELCFRRNMKTRLEVIELRHGWRFDEVLHRPPPPPPPQQQERHQAPPHREHPQGEDYRPPPPRYWYRFPEQ